jgi:nucleoside-diphosphate-sugar epimerase
MLIDTEAQLEERLSRPSDADIAAVAQLAGDLLVLGAGGKMGPSLLQLARRATDAAKIKKRIIAVARFTDQTLPARLQSQNIETIACDLLEPGALARLPRVPNVIFMAARKFGTTDSEHLTWAINAYLPGLVAETFRDSCIVCFSSGNVYPLVPRNHTGATESTPPAPQGEYAQSVLARERMFEYAAHRWGTRSVLLRLNYAVELRYGVLVDIAHAVFRREPVDLRMPVVNVIWQGAANSVCLRSLAHCAAPPFVLNVTGPETLPVRELANEFGHRFGIEPIFTGQESNSAFLNDASKAHHLFGPPSVSVNEMIDWIAHWTAREKPIHNKPTHFQTADGKY